MPRVKKGELSLSEIRNLARQHNKLTNISGIDKKSRGALLAEITKLGYRVDHTNKKIVKGSVEVKVGKEGEVKPQRRTLQARARRDLVAEPSQPMFVPPRHPPIPKNIKGKSVKKLVRKQLVDDRSQPFMEDLGIDWL